jgi:hypothetical protein
MNYKHLPANGRLNVPVEARAKRRLASEGRRQLLTVVKVTVADAPKCVSMNNIYNLRDRVGWMT